MLEAMLEVRYIIMVFVALFYLVTNSIQDLKTREVYDYSNFTLIALGLALNLLYGTITNNWLITLQSIAGYLVFVGIAYMMFYAGQWGGGDSKMLMGLGALIGLEFSFSGLPFLAEYFINILIIGALYAMVWSIILAIKNWKELSKNIKKRLADKLVRKIRISLIIFSVVLLIGMIIINNFLIRTMLFAVIFVFFLMFYLWIFIKAIEKSIMYKKLDIDKLTEGDWIVKDVKIDGKYICGPKDLGISKEAIEKLKKFKQKGKISKILVKEGIPFVPSFFLAFLFTLFFRNIWLFFF